jgi:hypothetical protein
LSVLTLELALTRLFSVVLFYHYAFLVISMALLGLATGAIFARLSRRSLAGDAHARMLGMLCLLAAISLLPILHAILNTNIWLVRMWETFRVLSSLYLMCMVPFALAGFVIASVMRAGSPRVASLYFFDLLGAGCGCLLFVPLINVLGGPNTVLAVAALWCVAAIAWTVSARSPRLSSAGVIAFAAIGALILVNRDGRIFDVRYLRGSPRKNELFARWNSFSRISVSPG